MSAQTGGGFNVRVIGALIGAGIIGFIGYWLLSAFAPDFGSGNGGTHALSRSATGFSGLYELAKASGIETQILRTAPENGGGRDTGNPDLLVLTPPPGTDPQKLIDRVAGYDGSLILIVLPKHIAAPDPAHRGWVRSLGRNPEADSVLPIQPWRIQPNLRSTAIPAGKPLVVAFDDGTTIRVPAPRDFVLLDGQGLYPWAAVGDGAVVASPDALENIYIVADPDLLNNRALADDVRATAALRLLEQFVQPGETVQFDVTLNGLGSGSRSLLRLAFTPPFLGLTLCFLCAALLALWQGFVRFGPPWIEQRSVALGKAALVENSARLIGQARRVPHFAARYAAMVREMAARRLNAPPTLAGDALDRWLDRFVDLRGRRFSQLAGALEAASNEQDSVERAAALGQWRKDVLRDGH